MPKVKNTGIQPIGIPGVLGSIQSGQEREIAEGIWAKAKDKPVVKFLLETGVLTTDEKPKKQAKPQAAPATIPTEDLAAN